MNMIGYFDNPSGEVHRLKLNRAAIKLLMIKRLFPLDSQSDYESIRKIILFADVVESW